MRNFLNAILAFIGAESLTDLEFATVTSSVAEYSQSTYDDLARILATRGSVSSFQSKLVGFYSAKGVTVSALNTGKSNIFFGSAL